METIGFCGKRCLQNLSRWSRFNKLICLEKNGAGEEIRTLDPNLGNTPWVFTLQQPALRLSTLNQCVIEIRSRRR